MACWPVRAGYCPGGPIGAGPGGGAMGAGGRGRPTGAGTGPGAPIGMG